MYFKPYFWLWWIASKPWKSSFTENINSRWCLSLIKNDLPVSLGLYFLYNRAHVCSGSIHMRYRSQASSCPGVLWGFHDKWECFTGSFHFFLCKPQYTGSCQSPVNFHIYYAFTTTNASKLTTSHISSPWPSRKMKRKDRNYYITEYLLLSPT